MFGRSSTDVFAAAYDLLARGYLGGPRAVGREQLPAFDAFLEAIEQIDPTWPLAVEAMWPGVEVVLDRAQRAYLDCLALPIPGQSVSPYASVYLDGGMLWGPSTFEVLRHYEAEGLSWDRERAGPGGTRLVAPDHVGVEMAFLAVISGRPTDGRADVARRERLRWFLGHTAAWLPKLAAALGPADRAGGLGRWTTWAAELVEVDFKRRGGKDVASIGAPRLGSPT